MENPNLNKLIQQVNKLPVSDQNFIIFSIIQNNKVLLKDNEIEFLEKSKEYLNELQSINFSLKKVIEKFE